MFFESAEEDGYKAGKLGKARRYILETLDNAINVSDFPKIEMMLGSSGTIRSIQKLLGKNGKVKRKHLSDLIDRLVKAKDLTDIPSLNPGRANIIVPGALLAQEIMIHLKTPVLYYTDYALRDGLLLKAIETNLR